MEIEEAQRRKPEKARELFMIVNFITVTQQAQFEMVGDDLNLVRFSIDPIQQYFDGGMLELIEDEQVLARLEFDYLYGDNEALDGTSFSSRVYEAFDLIVDEKALYVAITALYSNPNVAGQGIGRKLLLAFCNQILDTQLPTPRRIILPDLRPFDASAVAYDKWGLSNYRVLREAFMSRPVDVQKATKKRLLQFLYSAGFGYYRKDTDQDIMILRSDAFQEGVACGKDG